MARPRIIWFFAATLALVLVTTTAWSLIVPVKVVVQPAWQTGPFANATYVVYTGNSKAAPNHDDAFAIRRSDGSAVARLNAAGTEGYAGSFEPGTDRVIYQQVSGSTSDLYFFDVATRQRVKIPGVSSPAWEWAPRVSSTHILFFRNYKVSGIPYRGVYLWDRDTKHQTRIAGYRWTDTSWLFPGTVGERYATWSWCPQGVCDVVVYDAASGRTRKVPSPAGRVQTSPVLDESNDLMFFVRAGLRCGRDTTFYSVPLSAVDSPPVKVATLPAGVEAWDGSLMPSADGTANDLLFARVPCTGSADVYALPGVSIVGA